MVDTTAISTHNPLPSSLGNDMSAHLANINQDFAEEAVKKRAKELGMPYINITQTVINSDLTRHLDLARAKKICALPCQRISGRLRIAVADPENTEMREYIAELRAEHADLQLVLASASGIFAKLGELQKTETVARESYQNTHAEKDLANYTDEIGKLQSLKEEARSLAAAESLNRVLIGALRTGASDVHFQMEEQDMLLRFRVDGMLQEILRLDRHTGEQIIDHVKYESKLRLNIKNMPQDGRFSFQASGREIDVRVSSLPTAYGESIVCRLLDSQRDVLGFEQLGFEDHIMPQIVHALSQRSGLVLVTGPTGSGKTTTLYAMLERLNRPDMKITTLEDPIEYHLPQIAQSQINEEAGYGFASGLRALLRQDPDAIMVGEIRDHETAETAAQAAMTGHIVLSTLHTNSAIETIPRLINIGLPAYMLSASLGLVLAQRLVRRVHADCAKTVTPSDKERQLLSRHIGEIQNINPNVTIDMPKQILQAGGCPVCNHTGYHGQIALTEGFTIDSKLRELILAGSSAEAIAKYTKDAQGMLSLAADGILKVARGQTTLAEIARVTPLS